MKNQTFLKNIVLLIAAFLFFSTITHAQPGELDTSFGFNGVVKSDLGEKFEYIFFEKQVLEKPDGSMYVIIEQEGQTLIAKRDKEGKIDLNFGRNGISRPIGLIEGHAILQSDGKVVIVGIPDFSNRRDFIIARYNTDGTLDNSFSNDGKQTTKFKTDANATAAALQSDGKIVVAGYTPSIDDMGNKNSDFALARYNSDGSLDSSFSKDGKVVTTGNATDDVPTAVAIQSNGKILVAGYSANNSADNNSSFSTIIRYNKNGSIDSSFSADTEKFGFLFASPNAMAIQPDGKIVIAGQSVTTTAPGEDNPTTTTDIFIARYNTNGSIDKTFNHKGWETSDFGYDNEDAFAVAIYTNGKILVGCNIWNGSNTDFAIARYNSDGGLDESFSSSGLLKTDFDYGEDKASLLSIHKNGEIVMAGSSNISNFAVAHYNSDGSLDTDYYNDGKLSSNLNRFDQGSTFYKSTAIQSDDKIVVGGNTWNGNNNDFALVRYNTNGSLDSTFGKNGLKTTDLSVYKDDINSIAIQKDGKIVAGGFTSNQLGTHFALTRYNTDGSLDSTFSGNGIQNTNFNWNGEINSIKLQADGKIVAAGNTWNGNNNDIAVARYNTNGNLDSTFNDDGILQTDIEASEDNGRSVAIQSDGKIVVAGTKYNYANSDFLVVRYNADGSLDNSFNGDGILTADMGGNDECAGVVIQADGKIVVAGSTYNIDDSYYANTDIVAARFNNDGTSDKTFGKNGIVVTDLGNNDQARSADIESNGKILVGGVSNSRFAVIRYTPDGSLDTTFSQNGSSTVSSSGVNAIENQIQGIAVSKNKLYVVGNGKYPGNLGVVVRFQLDKGLKKPIVSITTPVNKAVYPANATIKIGASATDPDGTISQVEFYNGKTLLHTEYVSPYGYYWKNIPVGNYILTAKATDNSGMVTTSAEVKISVIPQKAPTVSITNPADNERFAGPATIRLIAAATDPEGTIRKVEFYNGSKLLRTERYYPYTYTWKDVPVGNYTITAKATDSFGLITTSAAVHISVVPNQSPTVSITNLANYQKFIANTPIPLVAAAKDPDGTISKVEFYNGDTLLNVNNTNPYTYTWLNVPAGIYTITAKATDNLGLSKTSAPVKIIVTATDAPIVSSRKPLSDDLTGENKGVSIKMWPNPAGNTLNINSDGLMQNKQTTLSVISVSGNVMKTMQLYSQNQTITLDVSSLASGVYTIRFICGDKVVYKQFVKL